jgi:hypothetical protein
MNLYRYLFLFFALAIADLASAQLNGLSKQKKDEAFKNILQLEQKAFDAAKKEDSAKGTIGADAMKFQRQQAFSAAADAVQEYIAYSLKDSDPASLEYLRAEFREAYDLDWADRDEEAYRLYKHCKSHPRLSDAKWGSQRMADLLEKRLQAVAAVLPTPTPTPSSVPAGGGNNSTVSVGTSSEAISSESNQSVTTTGDVSQPTNSGSSSSSTSPATSTGSQSSAPSAVPQSNKTSPAGRPPA